MVKHPVTAAVVHVNKSHPGTSPIVRPWIDGSWPLRGTNPNAWNAYLRPIEILIAVAYRELKGRPTLTIIDVRRVTGYSITGGRVDFSTVPAPELEHLLGQPSPMLWKRGEGWPIKVAYLTMSPPISGRHAA